MISEKQPVVCIFIPSRLQVAYVYRRYNVKSIRYLHELCSFEIKI